MIRLIVVVSLLMVFLPTEAQASGQPTGYDSPAWSRAVGDDAAGTGPAASIEPRPGRSWYIGGRTGFYSAAGAAFLGGEVFVPLTDRVSLNPNVEYVFVSDIDGLATFNVDAVYDFPFTSSASFSWLGAGVGVRRFAKGGGWPPESNLVLNLLGGVGFGRGREHMPFVQGKLAISDDVEFVLGAGFRF